MNKIMLNNLEKINDKYNRKDILLQDFFNKYDNEKVFNDVRNILYFERKIYEDNIINDKEKLQEVIEDVLFNLFGIYLGSLFGYPAEVVDTEEYKKITKRIIGTAYESPQDLCCLSPRATIILFFYEDMFKIIQKEIYNKYGTHIFDLILKTTSEKFLCGEYRNLN